MVDTPWLLLTAMQLYGEGGDRRANQEQFNIFIVIEDKF